MLFIQPRKNKNEFGMDQQFLETLIYDKYGDKLLTHDSFHCKLFNQTKILPFPTQRKPGFYHVGQIVTLNPNYNRTYFPCPKECRPAHGKHWEYCWGKLTTDFHPKRPAFSNQISNTKFKKGKYVVFVFFSSIITCTL